MTSLPPFWIPDYHAGRRDRLLMRGKIVATVREFFATQNFIEVEPAILQISPGNETHLHAFATELKMPAALPETLYLHTSPEFALKKLLAAGEMRLLAISRCFRNGEFTPLHHPEFTMLEWYRAKQDYTALMMDCADLVRAAAVRANCEQFHWRGKTCNPFADFERLSVAAAFKKYANMDILATLKPDPDLAALQTQAQSIGIRLSGDDTWSDIFSKVLSDRIEPKLGEGRLTILDEYPSCEAALARKSQVDPRVSERFELYACGIELANGFGELTDPIEQRLRFEAEMAEKRRIYHEDYPLDEDFLSSLQLMPSASGIALGLDRLIMLCTGATDIRDVLWTPMAEPL